MLKRLFLLPLFITTFVTTSAAQTAATVAGTVQDTSGAPLTGVSVTAKSGATGLTRTTTTGPEGRYVLMRAGDKRVYIFDFGKAGAAPAVAQAEGDAAAEGAQAAAPAEADEGAAEAKNDMEEKAPQ